MSGWEVDMDVYDRVVLAGLLWGLLLVLGNPFFESRELLYAALGMFGASTLAFIFKGFV